MKIPFTTEQFFEVFKHYNETVFPMQVILFLLALGVIYLTIRNRALSNKFINTILFFFWLWMGIGYHILFFSSINKPAYIFGAIFIIQGLLFLALGVFHNKLSFKIKLNTQGITGIVLIAFSLIIYPVIGYFRGHIYPSSPTFGLPCPTTIFTFGILLFVDKKCPLLILIIPFLWSIVGVSAAISLGVYEDLGLLVSGLIAVPMILIHNRNLNR